MAVLTESFQVIAMLILLKRTGSLVAPDVKMMFVVELRCLLLSLHPFVQNANIGILPSIDSATDDVHDSHLQHTDHFRE